MYLVPDGSRQMVGRSDSQGSNGPPDSRRLVPNVLQHPGGALVGVVGIKQVLHAADHVVRGDASLCCKLLVHFLVMLPQPCPLACPSVRGTYLAAWLEGSRGGLTWRDGMQMGKHAHGGLGRGHMSHVI